MRALLMLHPSIHVVFVRCDAHTVDLAYRADEDALYVHEKWLHPSASPAPAISAGLERDATVDVFACQHVVEELYHQALTLVLGRPDGVRSGPSIWQLVQLAQQKLRQMACMVQASRTEVARTLKVSFYTGHSLLYVDLHGAQSHYLVVLHVAGCPRQSVSLLSRTVAFGNLSQGPWIPTVAKMRDSPGLGEERLGHPSMKAQDGALIGVPPPAIALSGWEDAPVTGETGEAGSASSACKTSAPNAVRETMPLAAAAVASAGSRPLVQMEDNHDVDEGDEALFEANSIADVGNFLGEITQGIIVCGNEEPKDKAETSGADWALINPPFSSEATARSGEVGSGALLTNDSTETCKSEEQGTALSSMHQVVGDSSSPPSSAPQPLLNLPRTETAWWTAWLAQDHRLDPGDITNGSCYKQLDGSYELRDQYQQFARGKYVQVMTGPDASSGQTSRCILYIHRVLIPVPGKVDSPKLIATRYTFLADHHVLGYGAADFSDRELLLHFQNIDQMAKESDAELLDTRGMVYHARGRVGSTISGDTHP